MSSNAFNQSERDYNAAEERREIGKAERRSIADSAIYQQTAQLAEKYKAQRDLLLVALKGLHQVCQIALANKKGEQCTYFETRNGHFVEAANGMILAETAIAEVEQSL